MLLTSFATGKLNMDKALVRLQRLHVDCTNRISADSTAKDNTDISVPQRREGRS